MQERKGMMVLLARGLTSIALLSEVGSGDLGGRGGGGSSRRSRELCRGGTDGPSSEFFPTLRRDWFRRRGIGGFPPGSVGGW